MERKSKVEWPVVERFINNIAPAIENIKDQSKKIRDPFDVRKRIDENIDTAQKSIKNLKGLKFPLSAAIRKLAEEKPRRNPKDRYNPRLPLPLKTEKVHGDKTKYDRARQKDIAEELDRIADELEPQCPRLALALDNVCDHLEAASGQVLPPRSIEPTKDLISGMSFLLPTGVESKKRREEVCASKESLIKWLKFEGTTRRQMNYHSYWHDYLVKVAEKMESDKEYSDKVFKMMKDKIDGMNKTYEMAEKQK